MVRALAPFEGSAHDALAQNETDEYEIQARKLSLSLSLREPRGAGQNQTPVKTRRALSI